MAIEDDDYGIGFETTCSAKESPEPDRATDDVSFHARRGSGPLGFIDFAAN
jgi:hypothetical protein